MAVYIILGILIVLMFIPLELITEANVGDEPALRVRVKLAGATIYFNADVARSDGSYILGIYRQSTSKRGAKALMQLKRAAPPLKLVLPSLRVGAGMIMRSMVVKRASLDMLLGTGDAAASALLCGLARIMALSLCASLNVPSELQIAPDYASKTFKLHLEGIILLRLGHIIGAALAAIYEYSKGAFHQWMTRPSQTR